MQRQRRQTIVSALCAVLAVCAVFGYTASVQSEAATQRQAALRHYGGEQVEVVVATADIDPGQVLGEKNVAVRSWLVDLLPASDVARSVDQVEALVAQQAIRANEPVLLERVGDSSSRISVPQGLEAASVAADAVHAVGGAVEAGSLVDVYVETGKGTMVLLGENILVLETDAPGSGQGSSSDASKMSWVTLAVTPDSVNDLLSASAKGTVYLVLPGAAAQGVAGR